MKLIDATMQNKLLKHWGDNKENGVVFIPDFVIEKILKQPTIDAEPIVHAQWIIKNDYRDEGDSYYFYSTAKCSNCNNDYHDNGIIRGVHCTNPVKGDWNENSIWEYGFGKEYKETPISKKLPCYCEHCGAEMNKEYKYD